MAKGRGFASGIAPARRNKRKRVFPRNRAVRVSFIFQQAQKFLFHSYACTLTFALNSLTSLFSGSFIGSSSRNSSTASLRFLSALSFVLPCEATPFSGLLAGALKHFKGFNCPGRDSNSGLRRERASSLTGLDDQGNLFLFLER